LHLDKLYNFLPSISLANTSLYSQWKFPPSRQNQTFVTTNSSFTPVLSPQLAGVYLTPSSLIVLPLLRSGSNQPHPHHSLLPTVSPLFHLWPPGVLFPREDWEIPRDSRKIFFSQRRLFPWQAVTSLFSSPETLPLLPS